jgi:hypothetical protein
VVINRVYYLSSECKKAALECSLGGTSRNFRLRTGMWPPPISLRIEAGLPLGRPLLLPDIPLAAELDNPQGAQSCYDKRRGVRLREEKVKVTRAKLREVRQHASGLVLRARCCL